jgi:4'-phosphopantetheinyl transferase
MRRPPGGAAIRSWLRVEPDACGLSGSTKGGTVQTLRGADLQYCDLYWARVDAADRVARTYLDASEEARARQLPLVEDRERFVLAAALLRVVVALTVGIAPEEVTVDRTCWRCGCAHGRPRVVGHGLEVSVSHSGAIVVIAATRAGRVGVDVERVRPLDHALLSEEICRPGAAHPDLEPVSFYKLWTRKESILKATGVGLGLAMAEVDVTAPEDAPRLLSYAGDTSIACEMADIRPSAGYVGAVTVLCASPVAFRHWRAEWLLRMECPS